LIKLVHKRTDFKYSSFDAQIQPPKAAMDNVSDYEF